MYPVLMAADILLFNAHKVPVGRDQVQHIEMARDIGQRFNHLYGEHFALPEAAIEEHVATLPGLDGRKMSKSYDNTIPLFAPREQLKKLIFAIMTDSRAPGEPKDTQDSALFQLYQAFAIADGSDAMRQAFADGIAWGDAKQRLFERIDARGRADARAVRRADGRAGEDRSAAARWRAAPARAVRDAVAAAPCAKRSACATCRCSRGAAQTRESKRRRRRRSSSTAKPTALLLQAGRRRPRAAAERRLRFRARCRPAGRAREAGRGRAALDAGGRRRSATASRRVPPTAASTTCSQRSPSRRRRVNPSSSSTWP